MMVLLLLLLVQVHALYHFRPITAFLSVNYLDRFLSFHSLPVSNPHSSHPRSRLSREKKKEVKTSCAGIFPRKMADVHYKERKRKKKN